MSKSIKVKDNDVLDLTGYISLKQFPPVLRKLGKYLLQSDQPCTIHDACKAVGVNYDSVRSMIYKAKQNGNDFNKFIDEQSNMILHAGKAEVYKALQRGAVSSAPTSHSDRKTYLQLTGDLKEEAHISTGALTVGINISGLSGQDRDREKGVVDVTPFIPQGKS